MSFEKRKNNDIIIIGHQVTLPYCTIRSGVTYPATSTSTTVVPYYYYAYTVQNIMVGT